jgi:hypothetical protein
MMDVSKKKNRDYAQSIRLLSGDQVLISWQDLVVVQQHPWF